MTEKERNLINFNNLCVMVYSDGTIYQEEVNLLGDVVNKLGLGKEDIDSYIKKIDRLSFIILEDTEER